MTKHKKRMLDRLLKRYSLTPPEPIVNALLGMVIRIVTVYIVHMSPEEREEFGDALKDFAVDIVSTSAAKTAKELARDT